MHIYKNLIKLILLISLIEIKYQYINQVTR